MNKDKYLLFKGRLPEELDHLLRIETRLEDLQLYPEIKASEVKGLAIHDEVICTYLGSLLHAYYDHIEKILMLIAKSIDSSVPDGEGWHKELIDQMSIAIPEKRPAVINKTNLPLLHELRGFRHIYRNIYGDDLDPTRIENLIRKLPVISTLIREDFADFIKTMNLLYS